MYLYGITTLSRYVFKKPASSWWLCWLVFGCRVKWYWHLSHPMKGSAHAQSSAPLLFLNDILQELQILFVCYFQGNTKFKMPRAQIYINYAPYCSLYCGINVQYYPGEIIFFLDKNCPHRDPGVFFVDKNRSSVSRCASRKATELGRFFGITVKRLAVSVLGRGHVKEPYEMSMALGGTVEVQILLQSACTPMCRQIYNWNIVASCDVKQPISLTISH